MSPKSILAVIDRIHTHKRVGLLYNIPDEVVELIKTASKDKKTFQFDAEAFATHRKFKVMFIENAVDIKNFDASIHYKKAIKEALKVNRLILIYNADYLTETIYDYVFQLNQDGIPVTLISNNPDYRKQITGKDFYKSLITIEVDYKDYMKN